MNNRLLLSAFLLTCSWAAWGQRLEPIPWKGMYVIQKKGQPKEGENIFENRATMPDRTILDSSKQMIARKTGSPYGYIYYEWKNRGHKKSFQEIVIDKPRMKVTTYYTDSGQVTSDNTIWTFYFVSNNPLDLVEGIRAPVSKTVSDSLSKVYKVPVDLLAKGKFWTAYNFYESGTIKSTGLVFMVSGKEAYQIGKWLYYDGNGQLNRAEDIRQLRKLGR